MVGGYILLLDLRFDVDGGGYLLVRGRETRYHMGIEQEYVSLRDSRVIRVLMRILSRIYKDEKEKREEEVLFRFLSGNEGFTLDVFISCVYTLVRI